MFKRDTSPYLRALYIIIVPMVVLIIFLNSGILQRHLTAAKIGSDSYTVAAYNFYYFTYYNAFLEDNQDRLEEIGYDPNTDNGKQQYDDTMTWRDYFLQQAEDMMAFTTYYNDLAREAGYTFSQEQLSGVAEQLAANQQVMETYGLSANNFYVSYYGRGMTEDIFTEQLTRYEQAKAYREYLIASYEPTTDELADWDAKSNADYQSVNLRVITVNALTSRETKEVEARQMDALQKKVEQISERYDGGDTFEDLQKAFSTLALGDIDGIVSNATKYSLPESISVWAIDEQKEREVGDTIAVTDDAGIGYFVIFDGTGFSGSQAEAGLYYGEQHQEEDLSAAISSSHAVVRSGIGMTLSAN